MEEKITTIQETLDLSHEEAEAALRLAEGDLDKALKMRDYVERSFLIIRVKYKRRNSEYGLFSLLANSREGEFIEIDSVTGQIDELEDIDLDVTTDIFAKTIKRISDKNKLAKSIDYDLKEMFYPTEIFKLAKMIKADKREEANRLIKHKVAELLEEEVELSSYFKLLTRAQLKQIKPDLALFSEEESEVGEEIEGEAEAEEEEKTKLRVKLSTIPIVSPTKGKKVGDLKQGDRILIKINDNSELGRYFKKLLEKNEGMTVGEIKKIEFNNASQRYFIQVEIGPEIFTNIYLEPEIKLAVTQVSQEKFIEQTDDNNFIYNFLERLGPYITILPLVVIIIILLMIIVLI